MNRGQFQTILREVRRGNPASLGLDIEGYHYVRNFLPKERLILLGGGHVAQPLCTVAAMLGFSVIVVDDRPLFVNCSRFPEAEELICDDFSTAIERIDLTPGDYVAVITRGHRYDADCLRKILNHTMPRYLGMIGSRRRTTLLLNQLEQAGYSRVALDTIHTPIGLPIGALTTQEIAVSIAAELIQCRRQGIDRRSKSAVLTNEDTDLSLLEFLAEDSGPKAVLLVYETEGSTPVKTGSYMAVDRDFRSRGTIGGGCGESAALREAFYLIGTGESRCVTVNMSQDEAAKEGMVCGGQMKILLADLIE